MGAEEFIKLLVNNLNLKKIIVGYNHRFGKNRSADIHVLRDFSIKYDFEVVEQTDISFWLGIYLFARPTILHFHPHSH